jgi:cytochrome P450
VAMRALFGFHPERDAQMAATFERALGFWGRGYAAQMLRGPGSPYRAMVNARAWLDAVIFAEIDQRLATGERGLDLLSLLMDATDEDGSQLSKQELRDQVMTLLFAGHDTTTSTVTFLFYELARNPGDHDLELAIDETLRMYPPAWIGPRRSIEPFELHGVSVPGGVLVNYCSWASHHLAEVFPEPFEFRPERFTEDARAALPKGAYVPFGGGSRTCIGMRFGLLEVRTIAEAILERFTLELAEPDRRLSIRQMPTLSPRGGLPVTVHASP